MKELVEQNTLLKEIIQNMQETIDAKEETIQQMQKATEHMQGTIDALRRNVASSADLITILETAEIQNSLN